MCGQLLDNNEEKTIIITPNKYAIKRIVNHEIYSYNAIISIIPLQNDLFATSAKKEGIKILNPKKRFKCIQSIKPKNITDLYHTINNLCQLDNGDLVFSCGDNTIHFWDLKLNKHLLTINTICQTYQLILLSNNRLFDCYYFNCDIYKADRPYNNIPLMKKVLHSKNNEIYSIQYLKKTEEIIYATRENHMLIIMSMKTYQIISIMKLYVLCEMERSLYLIDDERVITKNIFDEFQIINIKQCKIVQKSDFKDRYNGTVFEFCLLNDKNSILAITGSKMFMLLYNIKENKIKRIENETFFVNNILRVKEDLFLTTQYHDITLWKEI